MLKAMSRHIAGFSVILLLTAAPLLAQLIIGSPFSTSPNSSDSNIGAVRTAIDQTAPASGTGTVTSVHVLWSSTGCANAIKIKFFRRSGNTLTMTAERGPFTSAADNTFAMSLAAPVLQGDLIGVARVANCGNPAAFFGFTSAGYVEFPSDVTGSVDISAGTAADSQLALSGSGPAATEQVRGFIPVVGSTAGGLGSNFKTSMQVLFGAPGTTGTITGKLVFHPAGTSGSSTDPTLSYTVAAGQVVTFPDVVAAFGRSGLGSVDLIAGPSATKPVIITRVFNDAGALGSAGLTEDVIDPSDARVIQSGFTGFLVTPVDPTKTRFNIGVRTFFSGATITAVLRDTNGTVLKTVSKTYLPNWFEQVDSTSFFGGTALGPNQSISISVTGSAIVYGSTTDDITNDPNIQFAVALFGVA
jgi:hypothetical protein